MHSSKKWCERLDWFLTTLMLLGIALYYVGISLNSMVLIANNGSMPIIVSEPMILLNAHDGRTRHFAKEESAKLLFLADHIRLDFPVINVQKGLAWESFDGWWGRWIDYPIEGGLNIVSIGDILRWAGSALFLLLLLPMCLRIPFRLVRGGRH